VSFVFGLTGPGNVSITVRFEDTTVSSLEYRFLTKQTMAPIDVPISSVTITSPDLTLPVANNSDIRDDVDQGTTITLIIAILPENATNQNYIISLSNSRGTVTGNQVTFTTPGLISVLVTFEDTSVGANGVFNYRFTIIEVAAPIEDVPISSVLISSPDLTLPNANDINDRPTVEIGTVITILVDILPTNATNKTYTIASSNSRAVVDGDKVSFVIGSGLGSVSVLVTFADTSVGNNGLFEYRFTTINPPPAAEPITSVTITSNELTLPQPNTITDRPSVEIGTVMTLIVDILPTNATNQTYTISSSNSRAVVVGNEVTFTLGTTGLGNVSVLVTFEDTSVGDNGVFEYRFLTIEAPQQNVLINSVIISSPEITLPQPNMSADRPNIAVGTVFTLVIDILPLDATNQAYTITVSNSRGTVNGQEVSFITTGDISVFVTFEDTSVGASGVFNYRFRIV